MMALQVVVEVDDIVKRDQGGTLTLRMKLFAEGVDPETADPLLDEIASGTIKGHVGGKTPQQLVNAATTEAGQKLVSKVLTYVQIEEYKTLVNTAAVKAAIEAALEA